MKGDVLPNSNETKHEYMVSLLINPRLQCCGGVSMSCTHAYVTINTDNANQHFQCYGAGIVSTSFYLRGGANQSPGIISARKMHLEVKDWVYLYMVHVPRDTMSNLLHM